MTPQLAWTLIACGATAIAVVAVVITVDWIQRRRERRARAAAALRRAFRAQEPWTDAEINAVIDHMEHHFQTTNGPEHP